MKRTLSESERVLQFIRMNPNVSSSEIHLGIGSEMTLVTTKRLLQKLVAENQLTLTGKGKSTRYRIGTRYELLNTIPIDQYFKQEIDERKIRETFNHALIREVLNSVSVFTSEELQELNTLQAKYTANVSAMPEADYKRELERLAIDLSWKSSQIEGNTYSLLETERLLKEQETAAGKTRDEATMLLDHKAALDFIIANPDYLSPLTIRGIEDIHSMLIKDLNIERNLRTRRVGISGTNYRPLDNAFQIREALEEMCTLLRNTDNVFAKALYALVLISYIQPFADGNKRTGRIICNAILMHHHYCPISFRTVDSIDYKKAMLLFYEQNNISAFKRIFIDQFAFAVKTYF